MNISVLNVGQILFIPQPSKHLNFFDSPGTKKLLKVEGMDIIANVSLNIHSFVIIMSTNHLCFHHDKTICMFVSDHMENSCI